MAVSTTVVLDVVRWVCSGVSNSQIADNEHEQMMALSWARATLSVKTNQAIMQLAGYVLGCIKSRGVQCC